MLPVLKKNKDPRVLYSPHSNTQRFIFSSSLQSLSFQGSGTEKPAIFNSHKHLQLCPLRGLSAPMVPLRVLPLDSHGEANQRKSCFI